MYRMFDGEEQQALNGLSEYVVGQKKIPYKIKNRILHVYLYCAISVFCDKIFFTDSFVNKREGQIKYGDR